jgi:hypothetical protein
MAHSQSANIGHRVTIDAGEGPMTLVERVKGILLRPAAEWQIIEREPGDPKYLFQNYVAILALIPAVAGFIGTAMVGVGVPGAGTVRVPIFAGLVSAILGYLLTFVIVYIAAYVIDALAPTFGGQRNFGNALKLAVFSFVPEWIAGIFLLVPALQFLVILGLYGIYVLYVGLPVLMKVPRDRALLYTAAVVAIAIVVAIVIGAIQAVIIA